MKICVVGLGYIGFPTACLLANAGHKVAGIDVNWELVQSLQEGKIHIKNEPALEEIAHEVLRSGALTTSTIPVESDVFLLCVPTPFKEKESVPLHDGLAEVAAANEVLSLTRDPQVPVADLDYVVDATRSIASYVRPENLVILESTVPPGTTEHVVACTLDEEGVDVSGINVAHAPERVLPGSIVREMAENDRIIGGLTPEATQRVEAFYRTFVKGSLLTTDATTAEFVKLMENTFRDVNIALANEFAQVSESLGVDVQEAIRLANHHPRVNVHKPGPGVGGHCISVDPYFVIERAPQLTPLMQMARVVNRSMPEYVVQRIEALSTKHTMRRVVLLGAAYKANVGDDRESPSLHIAQILLERGFTVSIHDPFVPRYNLPLEELVTTADALVLLTDHAVYRDLDPVVLGRKMDQRVFVDTRRHVDPEQWTRSGFIVWQLGNGRGNPITVRV